MIVRPTITNNTPRKSSAKYTLRPAIFNIEAAPIAAVALSVSLRPTTFHGMNVWLFSICKAKLNSVKAEALEIIHHTYKDIKVLAQKTSATTTQLALLQSTKVRGPDNGAFRLLADHDSNHTNCHGSHHEDNWSLREGSKLSCMQLFRKSKYDSHQKSFLLVFIV